MNHKNTIATIVCALILNACTTNTSSGRRDIHPVALVGVAIIASPFIIGHEVKQKIQESKEKKARQKRRESLATTKDPEMLETCLYAQERFEMQSLEKWAEWESRIPKCTDITIALWSENPQDIKQIQLVMQAYYIKGQMMKENDAKQAQVLWLKGLTYLDNPLVRAYGFEDFVYGYELGTSKESRQMSSGSLRWTSTHQPPETDIAYATENILREVAQVNREQKTCTLPKDVRKYLKVLNVKEEDNFMYWICNNQRASAHLDYKVIWQ